MTGPYVFGPQNAYQQTPYTMYYNTPQSSPFIPPLDIGNYPPSPYRSASPLPPSPSAGSAQNTINFPGAYEPFSAPPWGGFRPRAPSYHGPPPPTPMSPFVPPSPQEWNRPHRLSNPMIYPGVIPGGAPGGGYPPYSPFPATPMMSPYGNLPAGAAYLHPYINGEAPRGDISFNLAAPYFSVNRLVAVGQYMPLSQEELAQQATHPPVYSIRIVCDEIPEWPIELNYDPESYREQTGMALTYPPPISLGDVLSAIHRKLQEKISHRDWHMLDERRRFKISQAYTQRCASMGTLEQLQKNEGVKKVDYLMGKNWFKGLVRTGEGSDVLKLVIARR
ncbi:hypothetical protein AMATHDRAFT_42394 [Amanita thiersii Skay4041]|uniref:DUF6699 domain-containing protein n=1 Tax=Amanita thiersii Skay4041 TaxID=703135 RepID=A0A2A9NDU2_9AGAR|nr:hypothetical protein AMATHDRAFT_42394 [Amanita thiersii Skay4041]